MIFGGLVGWDEGYLPANLPEKLFRSRHGGDFFRALDIANDRLTKTRSVRELLLGHLGG